MTENKNNDFKKPFSLKIILSAIIITSLLFGGGVFTGYSISRSALLVFDSNIEDVAKDIDDFQLQFLFLDVLDEKAACPLLEETMFKINIQSYDVGTQLEKFVADKAEIDFERYGELKRDYSRLLITYWLLSKKMQDVCGSKSDTIVYFYKNACPDCDTQAFVLNILKSEYKESLLIFAIDGSIDEPSVEALKDYYNIKKYPSIIVNGELYDRFYARYELEQILANTAA